MVSKITDKVIATATEWQNRMLDKIYPIVYLDAMYFKVRSNGKMIGAKEDDDGPGCPKPAVAATHHAQSRL